MTNTHINVGGHKITTNKVGVNHKITTLETGFSGDLYWNVTNGICFVSVWGITVTGTGTNRAILKTLPKAKNTAVATIHYGNAIWGDWYITGGTTIIFVNNYTANLMYASLSYPVADDWVES